MQITDFIINKKKKKYLNAKPIVAGPWAFAMLEVRPHSVNVLVSSIISSL